MYILPAIDCFLENACALSSKYDDVTIYSDPLSVADFASLGSKWIHC